MSFSSVSEFESHIFNKSITFGIIYQKHHCETNNQFYMRCSFHRKQDPTGKKYQCGAFIFGQMLDNKISIQKIHSSHTHNLMTSEAIKLKLSQMNKSIPENIKEEAYRLFVSGESTSDIYNILKKSAFVNQNCPFSIDPLRNYLYNRNKNEHVDCDNISDMYAKFQSDSGVKKELIMKSFGETKNLQGLSFTFKEQIDYGLSYFKFNI